MAYSTGVSPGAVRLYGYYILGIAGVLAVRGLVKLTGHTAKHAYEAITKTHQERIGIRLREAERYNKRERFVQAIDALAAAEGVAHKYDVPLPEDFRAVRKRIYSDVLDLAVDRMYEVVNRRGLEGFVHDAEIMAGEIGPTAQWQLEKVWSFALQEHLRLAREYAEHAADRESSSLLSARSHFDRAEKYAAKLKLANPRINSELSSIDSRIREVEQIPQIPHWSYQDY